MSAFIGQPASLQQAAPSFITEYTGAPRGDRCQNINAPQSDRRSVDFYTRQTKMDKDTPAVRIRVKNIMIAIFL